MNESKSDISSELDPFWLTGKDLERHFCLEDALLEFSQLFKHEEKNDRGLVVGGVTYLEMQLEHILLNFLVDDSKEVDELLKYDQPLGTFGGRIRVAYCVGLISKVVRDDLRLVGKIRNRFAHDLYVSFEDARITNWCKALQWHTIAYLAPPHDAGPRDLFYVGVHQLVSHLSGLASIARSEKRIVRA